MSSIGYQNALIEKIHHEKFHEWSKLHVAQLVDNGEEVSEEVQTLAKGPSFVATTYGKYNINGFNFHTKSYDKLSDEPFILASQATQVYYVEDLLAPDWLAVRQPTYQRDLYDMFSTGNGNSVEAEETMHNLDSN